MTNRGRALIPRGRVSSASKSPVGTSELFSSRNVTLVSSPAGTRLGSTVRVQVTVCWVRHTTSMLMKGSVSSSTETRSRSCMPSHTAQPSAEAPATRNDRPRTVRPRSDLTPDDPSEGPSSSRRQRDAADDVGHHGAGAAPGDLRLGRGEQPVGKHGLGERLDVVGQHEVAAVQGRGGAPGTDEVQGGPRGGTQPQFGAGAGGGDDVDGVLLHAGRDVHRT